MLSISGMFNNLKIPAKMSRFSQFYLDKDRGGLLMIHYLRAFHRRLFVRNKLTLCVGNDLRENALVERGLCQMPA